MHACLVDGEGGGHVRTSLTGVQVGVDVTGAEKVWRTFQAIGDIAFAYAYSNVLIEIQASHYYYLRTNITFGLHKKGTCMPTYIHKGLWGEGIYQIKSPP